MLPLKGTNISCFSNKASGLIPEKQNQGKRKIEKLRSHIRVSGSEVPVWDYRATFHFSLPNSPRVISSGDSFSHSPNDWANPLASMICSVLGRALWWWQCFGLSGAYLAQELQSLRFWGSKATLTCATRQQQEEQADPLHGFPQGLKGPASRTVS